MGPLSDTVRLDGRLARTERSRTAVVDALLDLLDDGALKPTAADIATRAHVSLRLVFQHFKDLESLFAAAAERQMERLAELLTPVPPTGPLAERVQMFVRQRTRLLERITPVRRAAVRVEPFSKEVRDRLRRARALKRAEVEQVFATELDRHSAGERRELAAALAMVTSWPAWETLRHHQGLSGDHARRVMARTITALLEARR